MREIEGRTEVNGPIRTLKKCPFCGGSASIKATTKKSCGFTIWCECNDCYARIDGYLPNLENENTSVENIEQCKIKAIELWNRRK